ncbi:MAG TPA: SGNH/GDSL hydrolase family protein [Acidimicrobiia bacterium]|nr:SGNH/GDSL hydrolase family protein [Acidimicrobiia bacterium]
MIRRSAVVLAGTLTLAACGSGSKGTAAVTVTTATTGAPAAAATTTSPTRGASSNPTQGTAAAVTAKDPVVVGFGNSVPSGAACSCETFVSAYANMVASATNTKATVDNDAVSGSTSADVVNQLAKSAVQAHVKAATTVLIMTGANDFNDAFDQVSLGAPTAETYAPVATAVQDNLTAIVEKIHSLNAGARVVVLDYWAAMEDGAVAAKDYDAPTMAAAIASTTYVNEALTVAAKATGAMYVSTYTAFKGPAGANDPTALLAADGDHPDAAGHQLIAKTIYAALPTG